jgi:DNA-binding NarL/FixJ family response regulator
VEVNSLTATLPVPTVTPAPLPKVLLGDDHPLILDALSQMMKTTFDVLTVDNSQSFIDAVDEFRPDVAVLDISMPGADGFTTARRALARHPELPIVFLSMHSDAIYHEQAARVGAKAFVSKRLPAHELLAAIEKVLNHEEMAELNVGGSAAGDGEKLTLRQREVLRLIATGSSAKDIANELRISVRTAEFHRAAIMDRLGLHSTAQLTRYAMANDIA